MVEINLENKWVDLAIDLIATLIGGAAAALVGETFTPTINSSTGIKRKAFEAGRIGVETVVVYKVASTMSDEIRDQVSRYDELAAQINEGRKAMKENKEASNA